MEPLMIRAVDAARKLRRPVREKYILPVDKIQNLFESVTTDATYTCLLYTSPSPRDS